MCGIAGKISFHDSAEGSATALTRRMAAAIRHRGPDEFGAYVDEHAILVSTRLSIIDVPTGQQPITNEDQSLWVVFNGEIFNFVELREELRRKGHQFRTRSDTEVIVHAFEEYGLACFEAFNGQWSIALWDKKDRRLLLCRDRVGVRPLFVYRGGDFVSFGSEIKAIFADRDIPRKLDPRGIDQTFEYWSSIAPQTLFEGVEEISPGSFRVYDTFGRETRTRYWWPRYVEVGQYAWNRPFELTVDEAAHILEERLREATRLRMLRSDVPVGSYLSGGLDSSLIALLGRESTAGDFRTYSIRFEEAEFDESRYQRAMASTLHSRHEELLVTKRDIGSVFPEVVWHAERALLRTAPAPLFLLSKLVRASGIKAVLTGEGADEMLAGYDLFREAKIREFWASQPNSVARPQLFTRLYPYLARSPSMTKNLAIEFWRKGLDKPGDPGFSHQPRWSTTAALKRFLSRDLLSSARRGEQFDIAQILPSEFLRWDGLGRAQFLELLTLFSGYIISSQGDRMLMAHSVEGRFPFLDREVMAFCNSLPSDYKLRILNEKFLLKKLASGKIPEEIINRPKQPYRAPDAHSFFGESPPEYVGELLSEKSLQKSGIFEPELGTRLFKKIEKAVKDKSSQLTLSNSDNMAFVGILSAQLLHRLFVEDFNTSDGSEIRFTKFISNNQVMH